SCGLTSPSERAITHSPPRTLRPSASSTRGPPPPSRGRAGPPSWRPSSISPIFARATPGSHEDSTAGELLQAVAAVQADAAAALAVDVAGRGVPAASRRPAGSLPARLVAHARAAVTIGLTDVPGRQARARVGRAREIGDGREVGGGREVDGGREVGDGRVDG